MGKSEVDWSRSEGSPSEIVTSQSSHGRSPRLEETRRKKGRGHELPLDQNHGAVVIAWRLIPV